MTSENTLRLLAIIVPVIMGLIAIMTIGWLSWFVTKMGDKRYFPMESGRRLEADFNSLRDKLWNAIDDIREHLQALREWSARHEGMDLNDKEDRR